MDLLEVIRTRVLRKPLPNAAEADMSPPPTLAELADIHAKLRAERAEAHAVILTAPDRRDELLDTPGSDAAIRRLDSAVASAHLMLERLERNEPAVLRAIQARTSETRDAAWFDFRARAVARLEAIADVYAAKHAADLDLLRLRQEADRLGFNAEMVSVPWHAKPLNADSGMWRELAGYVARQNPVHWTPIRLWTVRFTSWTMFTPDGNPRNSTAYLTGQEAGFAPLAAWALVDSGRAEWPNPDDPTTIPPRPPKPKRKRKPAMVTEMDTVAGAPT